MASELGVRHAWVVVVHTSVAILYLRVIHHNTGATSWCAESGPLVGVAESGPLVGVAESGPPVGVVIRPHCWCIEVKILPFE